MFVRVRESVHSLLSRMNAECIQKRYKSKENAVKGIRYTVKLC